ncbi:MAG: glycerophosphodiester phosphodiesterase family protein [Pseudomonadota bacterium]
MKPYRSFLSDGFDEPAIVAHRGDWSNAPENSIKAIGAAADLGVEIAEIDVQKSSDGVFFLMHDRTLTRVAGRDEVAEALPWTDLSAILLRDRDGSGPTTDQMIPSLEAALDAARGRIYLDVDVKDVAHMPEVAAQIRSSGMADHVDIKIDVQSAQEAATLEDLQRAYGVMVMPKTRFREDTADDLLAILSGLDAAVVETKFDALQVIGRRAAAFRASGLAVWVNTLDDVACCELSDSRARVAPQDVWGALMAAGVSIFQTDAVAELQSYRNTLLGR